MFMVCWSWSHQCGNVSIDIDNNVQYGSITLSIIPMNKIVEFHMEYTKVAIIVG